MEIQNTNAAKEKATVRQTTAQHTILAVRSQTSRQRKRVKSKISFVLSIIVVFFISCKSNKSVLNYHIAKVEEAIDRTTLNITAITEGRYDIFDARVALLGDRIVPYRNFAIELKKRADQLVFDMQELKVEIIKYCDGPDASSLVPGEMYIGRFPEKPVSTFYVNSLYIKDKGQMEKPSKIMIFYGKGNQLKNNINEFRDFLITVIGNEERLAWNRHSIREILYTDDYIDETYVPGTWEARHFENLPLILVIVNLSKLQNDIRNAEVEVLEYLLQQM